MLGREVRVDDDGVAVQIQAVIGHEQHPDLVRGNAFGFEVEKRGKRVSRDRIHLTCNQHGFAHGKADVFNLDLRGIDAVFLHKCLPLSVSAIGSRGAQGTSL